MSLNTVSLVTLDQQTIRTLEREYQEDPNFRALLENTSEPYSLKNGVLYKDDKICVPRGSLRAAILHDTHDIPVAGHLGVRKTCGRLLQHYYWPALRDTVKEYITSCDVCQRTKVPRQKPFGLLKPLDPPQHNWQSITMDFIAPLPTTRRGHSAIFVVVDRLSKQMHVAPTKANASAPDIAKLFHEHVYRHHGLPAQIISDRDPKFLSKFWSALFRALGVKLSLSSAYHPQTDGQTEVLNSKVEEMLRAYTSHHQQDWMTSWLTLRSPTTLLFTP
jgi:hypothetical protein